ncbi:MAG: M1 family metallopeptidase [Bacteroidetes bacterium]|nr:M1 family metallopeptidase [Bacteroidota bacterium]MBS1629503.1 M1 family metallopeptidase [Bacteroidota bacterium]
MQTLPFANRQCRAWQFLSICFAAALLQISCNGPSQLTATQGNTAQVQPTDTSAAFRIFRTSAPRIWSIVNTTLTLSFDFEKKEAQGEELLQFIPYAHAADTLVLDAKSMKIVSVAKKSLFSDALQPLEYSYDGKQLKIDVRHLNFGNMESKLAQTIRIEYVAKPYATATGGSAAIGEDRGLYFINTDHKIPGKPVQIWTQGETESNSHWMPTIDKPNQRSTFSITLIVPDSMQTLSNGYMASSLPYGNGMRKDSWSMLQPIQVYAAMFAIGNYALVRDVWYNHKMQRFDVNYYVEPAFAPYAREMFRNTTEMMTYFSDLTGVPYPWSKYSQVVARDYVSGAMENTTASLFGEFVNKNARQLLDQNNEDVVSHELFHQWFGDYVTCESWTHINLNESFATFGEQLWRRYKHGQVSADEQAWNDLQTYLEAARQNDPPLVRYHYRSREDVFDRISYQKGASILRYMNSLMGDTLMSLSMKTYLLSHSLESAETDDWRLAVEYATGLDWTPFFNQWYFRGGHPTLHIRYAFDDAHKKMNVIIGQQSSPDSNYLYDLHLKAAILYEGKPAQWVPFHINKSTQQFSYPADAQGRYPLVIVDADHVLPGSIDEEKPMQMWMDQLKNTSDYISKLMAVDAAMRNDGQSLSPALLSEALRDTLPGISTYTLRSLIKLKRQSSRDVLLPQVKFLAQTAGNNKQQAAAFAVLGNWKNKDEIPAMIAAVNDSSYLVSGAALGALHELAPDTAYTLAQSILKQDPKDLLEASAWASIAIKGAPEDFELLIRNVPRVYGGEKMALATTLAQFAKATKDDLIFKKCLTTLDSMAASESIGKYRFSIGTNIYMLAKYYKDEPNPTRLNLSKSFADDVLRNETDADNQAKYRKMKALL